MNLVTKLLNRLNRVFNKEPGATPILSITPSTATQVEVSGLSIRITTATTTTTIDLSSITVAQMITALNAINGIAAGILNNDYSGMLARGVLDLEKQTINSIANLYYPTNSTWLEMQTCAWALDEQSDKIDQAEQCAYMHSASGEWLNIWMRDYCGIDRYDAEGDIDYLTRAIKEITAIKANNLSMSQLVKDALGINCKILDAVANLDAVDPADRATCQCKFVLDMAIPNELSSGDAQALITKVQNIAATHRAGGTYFLASLRKHEIPVETCVAGETAIVTANCQFTDTLVSGPILVGAGYVVGAPGLIVGTNNPMMEQALVTLKTAADAIVSRAVYGG